MSNKATKTESERHSHDHGHDHDHDHGLLGQHNHTPEVSGKNERVVLTGFVLTFGFMIAEVIGGVISGSLALIADAGHMFTDAAALALAWAGFRFGRRKGDDKRTFGYMRFEILAGFINALTLIVLIGWIVYEAIQRLITPGPVLAGPMLVVAILGLCVNIGVFWMLRQGDRDHINIKGATIHVLGDLLGSVAAIIAAIAIYFTGWTPIDPILSVLLSAIVLRSAWLLLKSSLHILMEGSPQNVVVSEMCDSLADRVQGVSGICHVHVWSITSGKPVATLEIQIEENADPARVVRELKSVMATDFGISHSTVEIDFDGIASDCSIDPAMHSGSHDNQHRGDDGGSTGQDSKSTNRNDRIQETKGRDLNLGPNLAVQF